MLRADVADLIQVAEVCQQPLTRGLRLSGLISCVAMVSGRQRLVLVTTTKALAENLGACLLRRQADQSAPSVAQAELLSRHPPSCRQRCPPLGRLHVRQIGKPTAPARRLRPSSCRRLARSD